MAVFTADHIIKPQEKFATAIRAGAEAAEANPASLVTFGIKPRSPHTGYGYLQRGEPVGGSAFRVAEFKEKPSLEVAEEYLRSGEYYWNSGMFVWRVSAIVAEIERLLPDNAADLAGLAADWSSIAGGPACGDRFAKLFKISIDFGVMEKARSVLVVEMDCDWKDLGSWMAIASTREADESGNVSIAERSLLRDCRNTIVVTDSDHLIVGLGLRDLVVVHSGDATLICRKDEVERVKDLAVVRQASFGDVYE